MLDSPSVARVRAALAALGLDAQIVLLAGAARTARDAAAQLGCEVGAIANSLVFRGEATGEALLVMASGANRVDVARLAAAFGEPVAKADAAFVRARSGFAIGGVAPVAHPTRLRAVVDRALLGYREIWAAAGHPHTVFRLAPADLVRITGGAVADVAAAA
ncbi:MAG: YbaK/EbsC family protein [Burkholderiales bacterium]|nr:YbaK/EbsC family protein [Burkholderiales bacterium]